MKPDDFCCGDALHRQYSTFQISTKLRQTFPRYELPKIGLVSSFFSFFLFLLFIKMCESYHKVETGYPIALKFGTQKDGVMVHLSTKFG